MTIPPEAKLAIIDSAIQSFHYLLVIFDVRKRDGEEIGKIKKDMRPLPIADRGQFVQVITQLENLAIQEKQNQKTTTINLLSSRLENLMISLATSQDSVGSRLTRIVQSSYETATEMGFQAEPIEIDDLSYRELAPEYRAFNIIAVSSALNLVHYYLQTPEYQTALLAFFDQKKESGVIKTKELLEEPILNQLSQKLAEHLHNQYELSLGNQEHWWRELDHTEESRRKKEKSVIVAIQLLIAVFEYLSQTKLRDTVLLNHQDKQNIRDINLTNQTSTLESWLHASLQEATPTNAENEPTGAVERTAQAAHQLWLMAKQNRNDGDLPLDTSTIAKITLPVKEKTAENIVLDPALYPFDQLHPQIKKKNRLSAQIALENLVSDLSNERSINEPLTKLAKLITYLSEMLTTNDNLSTHQTWENKDCELVTWIDLLTSRQYETWLMHRLAKENGLTTLNELASLDYFSLWSEKDEKTPYSTIPGESLHLDLHLSSRDLDRIPLLMAAITLYLQYYFYLMEHQSSYLNVGSHKQELEKVLGAAELVRFPDIGAIHQKLANI